ncbi:MAG TPA: hypothetical protein VIF15_01995 [Polyangiaceae bacterium]|jgi:hypothetical protein
MKLAIVSLLLVAGCSAGPATPAGACAPPDPACTSSGDDAASADAPAGDAADGGDAACPLWVDDAGVTHGCNQGGHGPGDHDDGGDAAPPPPPDASPDASDLPQGASCLDNAQCASGMCFDFAVKGQFCSQACDGAHPCPAPSPGCNGMGVCREGS